MVYKIVMIYIFYNLFSVQKTHCKEILEQRELTHRPTTLTIQEIQKVATRTKTDYDSFNKTLDEILIKRVPETSGHLKVQNFIKKSMNSLNWVVEEDKFTDSTPHGFLSFNNMIATLNPESCKRLVFACHYDSKYFPSGDFVGATDSAVPCAINIHLAQKFNQYLNATERQVNPNITLQLIFFDGEEAFERWSDTDSLYGSRHLANKWAAKKYEGTRHNHGKCSHLRINNELDRIEVLVLLDLIGSSNPRFFSYFFNTQSLYARLENIEKKLNTLKMMETPKKTTSYFRAQHVFSLIQDDHIPFHRRGVPIVHVIPSTFPKVWHKPTDNKQNLHHPTINNLLKIFQVFIGEYLFL